MSKRKTNPNNIATETPGLDWLAAMDKRDADARIEAKKDVPGFGDDAEDEADERATQLFTALAYVAEARLGCLVRFDSDSRVPLMDPDSLNGIIEAHAQRMESRAHSVYATATEEAHRLRETFKESPLVGHAAVAGLMESAEAERDRLLRCSDEARAAKLTIAPESAL